MPAFGEYVYLSRGVDYPPVLAMVVEAANPEDENETLGVVTLPATQWVTKGDNPGQWQERNITSETTEVTPEVTSS